MGWTKIFGGYDAEATRGEVAARFTIALQSFVDQDRLTARINAAANTLVAVFPSRPDLAAKNAISFDVLPFACLSDPEGMFGLAEYAVFKERRAKADLILLKKAVRNGIAALMREPTAKSDIWTFGLWKLLDRGEPPLWASLLDEDTIGKIVDGSAESAKRLAAGGINELRNR